MVVSWWSICTGYCFTVVVVVIVVIRAALLSFDRPAPRVCFVVSCGE